MFVFTGRDSHRQSAWPGLYFVIHNFSLRHPCSRCQIVDMNLETAIQRLEQKLEDSEEHLQLVERKLCLFGTPFSDGVPFVDGAGVRDNIQGAEQVCVASRILLSHVHPKLDSYCFGVFFVVYVQSGSEPGRARHVQPGAPVRHITAAGICCAVRSTVVCSSLTCMHHPGTEPGYCCSP